MIGRQTLARQHPPRRHGDPRRHPGAVDRQGQPGGQPGRPGPRRRQAGAGVPPAAVLQESPVPRRPRRQIEVAHREPPAGAGRQDRRQLLVSLPGELAIHRRRRVEDQDRQRGPVGGASQRQP
ncbi:hypothetical protein RZS08_12870, partial [Arthrospira platensis SPKY1]|nr:hypothetical protein [Arthrospira platensis SPKY1]